MRPARIGSTLLLPLLLVLVAAAVALLGAPTAVRAVFAGPVLIFVTGDAARRLLVGRDPAGTARRLADVPAGVGDGLLNIALGVVLGLLLLLDVVLLVYATGQVLTAPLLIGSSTALSVVLVIAAYLTNLRSRPEATEAKGAQAEAAEAKAAEAKAAEAKAAEAKGGRTGSPRRAVRTGVGILLTAAALIGALAGARALRPPEPEQYTMFVFTEAERFGETPISATHGASITLGLGLTSYGTALPAGTPSVQVSVGGATAGSASSRWYPIQADDPFDDGAQNERRGTVTFAAPSTAGLYRVQLSTPDPQGDPPLLLTADLQVR